MLPGAFAGNPGKGPLQYLLLFKNNDKAPREGGPWKVHEKPEIRKLRLMA